MCKGSEVGFTGLLYCQVDRECGGGGTLNSSIRYTSGRRNTSEILHMTISAVYHFIGKSGNSIDCV